MISRTKTDVKSTKRPRNKSQVEEQKTQTIADSSTRFFLISNTFISNARLKLTKSQVNAKQHLEAKLLKNLKIIHSSSTLSPKNNRAYSKNKQNSRSVCFHEIIIIKMEMKMKNRSHKDDINRPVESWAQIQ